MASTGTESLIIPDGINYECTGCGKCCSGWSVPLTADDYERISEYDWAKMNPKFETIRLFRELKDYERKNSPYTHAIKHGDDGYCPFLVDNLCYIHSKFESKTKPSICQLFPYCFNETPSGVYATVSFVSVGAVKNSGRPLSEQREYLEKKYAEFKALYPDHHPNWSNIELAKQVPLDWDTYIKLEELMLSLLSQRDKPMKQRLAEISYAIISVYLERRGSKAPEKQKFNLDKVSLRAGDVRLLKELHHIYFPTASLSRGDKNFQAFKYMFNSTAQTLLGPLAPRKLSLAGVGHSYDLDKLLECKFDESGMLEDILYRFIYQRIFGKLYFGAGYGQLSLMAGFHHLALVFSLLKLQARLSAVSRGKSAVEEADLVASVRTLEKRLGDTALDGWAAAVFEYCLQSHGRLERILAASG